MKYPILAIILLAFAACENPAEHFTDRQDNETIVIPNCPTDSTGADTVRTCK